MNLLPDITTVCKRKVFLPTVLGSDLPGIKQRHQNTEGRLSVCRVDSSFVLHTKASASANFQTSLQLCVKCSFMETMGKRGTFPSNGIPPEFIHRFSLPSKCA